MKTLILGYAGHGKTTLAQTMFQNNFIDSSLYAFDRAVWPAVADRYATPEDAWANKNQDRKIWYTAIASYNHPDPTRLARELLNQCDVYVGMRRRAELDAAFKAGLFDQVFWVDASERLPVETGSMDFDLDYVEECAYRFFPHKHVPLVIFDNNGDELCLRQANAKPIK